MASFSITRGSRSKKAFLPPTSLSNHDLSSLRDESCRLSPSLATGRVSPSGPPVMLESHPLRHLSTCRDFHRSTPTLAGPAPQSRSSSSSRSTSPCFLIAETSREEEDERHVYSRLSREDGGGHRPSSQNSNGSSSGRSLAGYSHLNIVGDVSPPANVPSCDGYTYIDLEDLSLADNTANSENQSSLSTADQPQDKPEHHYFVLEIPENSTAVSKHSENEPKGNEYFTLEEPPSYANLPLSPDKIDNNSCTSEGYSYVQVDWRRFQAPRNPVPPAKRDSTPEPYEMPIPSKGRAKYKPISVSAGKRMGVTPTTPHPDPAPFRRNFSTPTSRSPSLSPKSLDEGVFTCDHTYSRMTHRGASPSRPAPTGGYSSFSRTSSHGTPSSRLRLSSEGSALTAPPPPFFSDRLHVRSQTMASLSVPDERRSRCSSQSGISQSSTMMRRETSRSFKHHKPPSIDKELRSKTPPTTSTYSHPHSSHVNLIITANGPVLVPSGTS